MQGGIVLWTHMKFSPTLFWRCGTLFRDADDYRKHRFVLRTLQSFQPQKLVVHVPTTLLPRSLEGQIEDKEDAKGSPRKLDVRIKCIIADAG